MSCFSVITCFLLPSISYCLDAKYWYRNLHGEVGVEVERCILRGQSIFISL
jgi:hypothetical protein